MVASLTSSFADCVGLRLLPTHQLHARLHLTRPLPPSLSLYLSLLIRPPSPPASLLERVARITPTWKSGGTVDYTWGSTAAPSAGLALFDAAAAPADPAAADNAPAWAGPAEAVAERLSAMAASEKVLRRLPDADERPGQRGVSRRRRGFRPWIVRAATLVEKSAETIHREIRGVASVQHGRSTNLNIQGGDLSSARTIHYPRSAGRGLGPDDPQT